MNVDETTGEEEVVGDEEVIAGIKFEGDMTTSGLKKAGGEMAALVGVQSSK